MTQGLSALSSALGNNEMSKSVRISGIYMLRNVPEFRRDTRWAGADPGRHRRHREARELVQLRLPVSSNERICVLKR